MIIMEKKSVILILSFVFFIAVCCCQRNQGITKEQLLEQKEKVAHQLAVDSFVTALNMLDSLYFVCPHDPQIPFLRGVVKTALRQEDEAKVDFKLSAHKYDSLMKERPSYSDAINYAFCILLAEDSLHYASTVDSLSQLKVYKENGNLMRLYEWKMNKEDIIPEIIEGFKENYP